MVGHPKPHKLTLETCQKATQRWIEIAGARTCDGSQFKTLRVALGRDIWQTTRQYLMGNEGPEVVCEGTLTDCMVQYNKLG